MKEKYEEMKMEIIAFEKEIWTQMGVTPSDVSNGRQTATVEPDPTGRT